MLAETCAQLKDDLGPNFAADANDHLHTALQRLERNATQPNLASSGSGCVHCPRAPVPSHFDARSVYATVECAGLNSFWGRSASRFWQRSNTATCVGLPRTSESCSKRRMVSLRSNPPIRRTALLRA